MTFSRRLRRESCVKQERQLDVLECGQHRDQVVGLEDEADIVGPPAGDLAPRQSSPRSWPWTITLPLRRAVEPGNQVQERRLARARRAHERQKLPFLDRQIEADQNGNAELVAPVFLVDTAQDDRGHFGHGP